MGSKTNTNSWRQLPSRNGARFLSVAFAACILPVHAQSAPDPPPPAALSADEPTATRIDSAANTDRDAESHSMSQVSGNAFPYQAIDKGPQLQHPARPFDYSAASQEDDSIRVEVRYPTAYGYKSADNQSPFAHVASPSSCDEFALNFASSPAYSPGGEKYLTGVSTDYTMHEANGYFFCVFVISPLPHRRPIRVDVSMSPSTDAWLGGSQAQPAFGQHRAIQDGSRRVILTEQQPRVSLIFNMVYAGGERADRVADAVRTANDAAMTHPTPPDPPICAYARSARAHNSPAASGLEKQCLAAGGTL